MRRRDLLAAVTNRRHVEEQPMMEDLMEWLREQINDDERVGREAGGDPWNRGDRSAMVRDSIGAVVVYDEGDPSEAQAAHIIRWNPARVLREVEAKRQILDHIAGRLDPGESDGGWESVDAETDGMASAVLQLLALPYADRPGYRDEWRP